MNKPNNTLAIANSSLTDGWQYTTPEEQGMDSSKLVEMMQFYADKHSKNEKQLIDSITIIRNGFIIADFYLNPLFPKDTKHVIHSCTKSIISALIGIAIELGYIAGVDTPILDLLRNQKPDKVDNRLQALTLKNLLTMQTGIRSQDSFLYEWRGLFKMQASDDWTEHILSLPVEVDPGQRFDYSNMSSFLLSAIITESTGTDTLSFARKYLFEPLGINDVKWQQSPRGIYIGFARMWLKPHDMAKFGLLYLQKGNWNGRQIIPSYWVEASTTPHSFPKQYTYLRDENGKIEYIKSGGIWLFTNLVRPFSDGYGYQWWLDKTGMYTALGVSGQYIIVVPQHNLIVVFTSKLSGRDVFLPATMLKKHILPAIVSDKPIPANKRAQLELATYANPPASLNNKLAVPELPPVAVQTSDQVYALESNPWRNDDFQLRFTSGLDYAEFQYSTQGNKEVCYRIGLDNVYRLTESHGDTYAAIGSWSTPNTFVLEHELIGYSNRGQWTLTFYADEILVREDGVTGVYTYKGKSHRIETGKRETAP